MLEDVRAVERRWNADELPCRNPLRSKKDDDEDAGDENVKLPISDGCNHTVMIGLAGIVV